MIRQDEIALARECIQYALEQGASDIRITLTKSTEDLIATLDGEVDRVTHNADRSMSIAIFVDGRFGSFSINKLERQTLRDFIGRAIETVRMLAPDSFRKLPDPGRCCKTAITGLELGTYDPAYSAITPEDRRRIALDAAVSCHPEACCPLGRSEGSPSYRLISEEGEYSDSEYDVLLIDSRGLECRHLETSFDYGVEVTIEDAEGQKYSNYYWTSSALSGNFDPSDCGAEAVRRAAQQLGAAPAPSGRYNMIVSSDVASRLVSPLLNALNAYSIQQGNSFLAGSLGERVFSHGLSIVDEPWRKAESCSKLFDSEGVATEEAPIIEGGRICRYFVNTYMAGKMDIEPTIEDAVRPRLLGWPSPDLDLEAIIAMCGDGIIVTDFNGGNCNTATGDFSYGITGLLIKDGVVVRPVNEMLITGNYLQLWKNLIAAGSDFRLCSPKLIGTLAFSDVDFSG